MEKDKTPAELSEARDGSEPEAPPEFCAAFAAAVDRLCRRIEEEAPGKQPITLELTGSHNDGEDWVELVTEGFYFEAEDGTPVLEYPETELSGMAGSVTRLFFDGDTVTMRRVGAVESCMVFCSRRATTSAYEVAGLSLALRIFPTELDYELSAEAGWLKLAYELEMGGQSASSRLELRYTKDVHDHGPASH